MQKLTIIFTLVLLTTFAAHAQDWQHEVNENGLRTARIGAE